MSSSVVKDKNKNHYEMTKRRFFREDIVVDEMGEMKKDVDYRKKAILNSFFNRERLFSEFEKRNQSIIYSDNLLKKLNNKKKNFREIERICLTIFGKMLRKYVRTKFKIEVFLFVEKLINDSDNRSQEDENFIDFFLSLYQINSLEELFDDTFFASISLKNIFFLEKIIKDIKKLENFFTSNEIPFFKEISLFKEDIVEKDLLILLESSETYLVDLYEKRKAFYNLNNKVRLENELHYIFFEEKKKNNAYKGLRFILSKGIKNQNFEFNNWKMNEKIEEISKLIYR